MNNINCTQLLMKEGSGWIKHENNNSELWISGYIHDFSPDIFLKITSEIETNDSDYINKVEGIVSELHGQFAIVLVLDNIILCVADRIRSIPLFYHHHNQTFCISNSPDHLKTRFNLTSICSESILEIAMSGYSIGRKTAYKDIMTMMPGEFIAFDRSTSALNRKKYYTFLPGNFLGGSGHNSKSWVVDAILRSTKAMVNLFSGRQLVIFLSAGYDSRLIISALYHIGYKNVIAVTYGKKNHIDEKVAKEIALKLNYRWVFIEQSNLTQYNQFKSNAALNYYKQSDTFSNVPSILDFNAMMHLKKNSIIDSDSVIINGNTGDFISGGHLPLSLLDSGQKDVSNHILLQTFINKHFSLWKCLNTDNNNNLLIERLSNYSNLLDLGNCNSIESQFGKYETLEYEHRQSKLILSIQQCYNYFGHDCYSPLWDSFVVDAFEKANLSEKMHQQAYKQQIFEANWGGVWNDIPINIKMVRPRHVSFVRSLAKIFFIFSPRVAWHDFDKRFLYYFYEDTGNIGYVKYKDIIVDRFGYRNSLSWRSKEYIEKFEFSINKL